MMITTKGIFVFTLGLILGSVIVLLFVSLLLVSTSVYPGNYLLSNDSLMIDMNLIRIYSQILIASSIFFFGVIYYLKNDSNGSK